MKHAIATALFAISCTAAAQGPAPIATQGTASVTMQDVDARAASIPADKRGQVFDSPQRIQTIVSGMLLNRQLAAEAEAEGLDKDPLIQRQLQIAREGVLARARLEQFKSGVKVDAETIAKETYQVNPGQFTLPEQRVVRQILIRTEPAGRLTAQSKLAEAQAALAKGESFADVAKKYSEDAKSAANGGLVDAFPRGRMVKPFEDAAFALAKPGDRSPVIESSYGFHLVELVSVEPARQQTFDEVKETLVAKVAADQTEAAAKSHVDELRNNPIEADENAILSLRTRYADDAKKADASKLLEAGEPVDDAAN